MFCLGKMLNQCLASYFHLSFRLNGRWYLVDFILMCCWVVSSFPGESSGTVCIVYASNNSFGIYSEFA